jgi:NADH-quinone oxidoreductase subunit G
VRKAEIDLPTFCYHSELSVYGACRLCLVQVEGRGIMGACSTPPEPGLKILTTTPEIREIRRIAVELLLANHDQQCPTCARSTNCQLQSLAQRLGIRKVRFKPGAPPVPLDESSPSLVRDPNKCVLCGDCVRMCSEIQGIGAIDFAHRGHEVSVTAGIRKAVGRRGMRELRPMRQRLPDRRADPKSEVDEVWDCWPILSKTVLCRLRRRCAWAGRVLRAQAGRDYHRPDRCGARHLGFDQVYDTSFAADLTVVEEGTEFLKRKQEGGKLPMFTSCCPGWVKYAEQYFPELLPNLSTCRSPQAMFGSLIKAMASRATEGRSQEREGCGDHAVHGQEIRSAAAGAWSGWRSGRG